MSPSAVGRWAMENPGNRAIHEQRARLLKASVHRYGAESLLAAGRTLDLGCGAGTGHRDLVSRGLVVGRAVGLDRNVGRLAHARNEGLPVVAADAGALPFQACTFVAIRAFTFFSSVPREQRVFVAQEVSRVLTPGGLLLWYDMRVTHPLNGDTVSVSRRETLALFPDFAIDLEPATVVPQVARHLGPATNRLYRWMSRLPGLSTHLVGVLRKPL